MGAEVSDRKVNIDKRLKISLPSIRDCLLILFIGLIIGYLGPFGSFETSLWVRLIYWVMAIAIGHFIFSISYHFCYAYADKQNIHFAVTFIIGAAIGSLFLSIVLVNLTDYFFDFPYTFKQGLIFIYPQVFVLGVVLGIFNMIVSTRYSRYFRKSYEKSDEKPGENFLGRLPTHLGRNLICIVTEDHYLRVYTDNGDDLILHRMRDALIELEKYDGFQVHRSWWVAKNKIKNIRRNGRKMMLIMSNDIEVPVSRTYQSEIKT